MLFTSRPFLFHILNLQVQKHRLKTFTTSLLADTLTPVGIYLSIRDKYPNSLLLESSDYHGNENSRSFICCDPIATFKYAHNLLEVRLTEVESYTIERPTLVEELQKFTNSVELDNKALKSKIGFYGYQCYDAVQQFETVQFRSTESDIPIMFYALYRYVVSINHFNDTLEIIETIPEGSTSALGQFKQQILNPAFTSFNFKLKGIEESNNTENEFLKTVEKGIDHCQKGDVFQVVFSRRFKQQFLGDEFNVYRSLRAVNPSPYLFYFDYGSFKLMGSSPEAQIVVEDNKATIHPIAGTFKRTGDDAADTELAKKLGKDIKENSEHVMLVDLARNDLSKSSNKVEVEVFKEVQYYSHVIHLVSKVTGEVDQSRDSLRLMANTFPAGTLSGAPKYKAMQLIDEYENGPRGFYGGAIGFLGLDGSVNQAIMIRSLQSKNNELSYQAGAGIVAKSIPENELKEVDNKLGAIRQALKLAEEL